MNLKNIELYFEFSLGCIVYNLLPHVSSFIINSILKIHFRIVIQPLNLNTPTRNDHTLKKIISIAILKKTVFYLISYLHYRPPKN